MFVVALLVAVVGVVVAVKVFDDGQGEPVRAEWRIVPGTVLGSDDTRVPVVVHETACASGRSADGRVVADVAYEATVVLIDIRVHPLGGDQDCQSNPDTSFVVELDEPLDDRAILGERWSAP